MSDKDVVLLAGLTFEMQNADVSWQEVPSLTSIGATGEQAEAKEKTHLKDRIKKYGSGLRDAPDKNITGQYIPLQELGDEFYDDYILQQAFIERCKREEEFNVRISYPDLPSPSFGYLYKSLGFQIDEGTQADWKMFTCNGKQNSRIVGAITVAGTATVAVAGTVTLAFTTSPDTLVYDEYADSVIWSSSDELVATVDQAGVVTGVGAGTCNILVEVRGVTGTLEMTVTL